MDATGVTIQPAEEATFEQALASLYPNGGFERTAFQSDFNERRAKAVAEAMAGNRSPARPRPQRARCPTSWPPCRLRWTRPRT
jgi:hypothetical protein